MQCSRIVPDRFAFAWYSDQLNTLLHGLVALFQTAERVDSRVLKEQATQLLRGYLDHVKDLTERAAACRLLLLPSWANSDECRHAIFSTFGQLVFECWLEEFLNHELESFLKKHGLVKLTVEARGPRHDRELGGVIMSPTHGRIAYVHPKADHSGRRRTHAGAITVVPLNPEWEASLIRIQGDGTKIYELDLRSLLD